MDIPEPRINCLRCVASEPLELSGFSRTPAGELVPVNVRRPGAWIAGPASPGEFHKGICPKCAPEWKKLEASFLATPPEDPTVEVREPEVRSVAPVDVRRHTGDHPLGRRAERARLSTREDLEAIAALPALSGAGAG